MTQTKDKIEKEFDKFWHDDYPPSRKRVKSFIFSTIDQILEEKEKENKT